MSDTVFGSIVLAIFLVFVFVLGKGPRAAAQAGRGDRGGERGLRFYFALTVSVIVMPLAEWLPMGQ